MFPGRGYSSVYSPTIGALGDIDIERCPHCSGKLIITAPAHPYARGISASIHKMAAIEDPAIIVKIPQQLGLPTSINAKRTG